MPAKFKRKVRKMRGSHTHGWGSKKKHRGSGSRAGVGASNWLYAKRSLTYSYQKERLGKKGFDNKTSTRMKSINLEEIENIARKNNLKEVDIKRLGFDKVLGSGRITIPLTVKAPKFSGRAKEKIEQAGGKAISGEDSG